MNNIYNLYLKYREICTYLIFGVLTTVVGLVTYYGLTFRILNPDVLVELQLANFLSWVFSVLFAYVTNRRYVFNSKTNGVLREFSSFVGSRILTLFMDMIIMFIGVTLLSGNDKIIKIISQVVVIISNYVLSKVFVFRK